MAPPLVVLVKERSDEPKLPNADGENEEHFEDGHVGLGGGGALGD